MQSRSSQEAGSPHTQYPAERPSLEVPEIKCGVCLGGLDLQYNVNALDHRL